MRKLTERSSVASLREAEWMKTRRRQSHKAVVDALLRVLKTPARDALFPASRSVQSDISHLGAPEFPRRGARYRESSQGVRARESRFASRVLGLASHYTSETRLCRGTERSSSSGGGGGAHADPFHVKPNS